jgi:hypothetical protein
VRAAPEENAAVLMTADKGVLLELVDPKPARLGARAPPRRHQRLRQGSEVWGI